MAPGAVPPPAAAYCRAPRDGRPLVPVAPSARAPHAPTSLPGSRAGHRFAHALWRSVPGGVAAVPASERPLPGVVAAGARLDHCGCPQGGGAHQYPEMCKSVNGSAVPIVVDPQSCELIRSHNVNGFAVIM